MDEMTQELPFEENETAPSAAAEDSRLGHAPEAVQSLKQAMRRARFDDAERVSVMSELRATQIGRLELLQESLRPLLAQVPPNVEIFDVGIMPGATPRLFIDMIGFVEMGRDARVYRLLQDTTHSRISIAESADIDTMVAAITDYVARRLIERDKALAADAVDRGAIKKTDVPKAHAVESSATEALSSTPTSLRKVTRKSAVGPKSASELELEPGPKAPSSSGAGQKAPEAVERRVETGWQKTMRLSALTFAFVIDLLGATTFFLILVFAVWLLWDRLHGQI